MSDGRLVHAMMESRLQTAENKLNRVQRENEELRGLLKRLESIMDELTDGMCRICGADMYEGSDGFKMNHTPDCELARALGGTP